MTLGSRILGRLAGLPRPTSRDVEVISDVEIPMRDGTVLLAERYVPAGAPAPTVLVRTPYGRSNWIGAIYGRLLAERGLHSVVQSCRGTFGSGGDFDAFNELVSFGISDRFVYRHKWRKGDMVVWDNRCTMHSATSFERYKYKRDMRRTTINESGPELSALEGMRTAA